MKNLKRVAVFCFIIFLVAAMSGADGLIIVEPPLQELPLEVAPRPRRIVPKPLPVKYHHVTIDINNQVAKTHIDQVFKNPYNRDMEGTYIFPLPEDASISEFAMYMDGEKVKGEILEKEEARRIYEDIVRRMKDPGLLEYIGRNLFKARVYPIPAKGEKRIELEYYQTLKYDAGMIRYTYPLDTERFSPTPLEDVSIKATIKSEIPIKTVYSPSHPIDITKRKNEAVCGYEESDVLPEKDFHLYYTVSEKDIGMSLLTYNEKGDDGYFMLMISPGEVDVQSLPKDIVFVLDTSGSMKGEKIEQAKEALKYCIESLNDDDRFNIITFATSVNPFKKGLVESEKDILNEAVEYVSALEARGGTDINSALTEALDMFPESDRPRMTVFLTDGEPTVGITDRSEITANVEKANERNSRVFVFGVGHNVNALLLDKIAEDNRGVPEYVEPDENIEVKVSAFYEKVSEPVLSNIEIDFGKIDPYDIYPKTLPDLFKGTQLTILGRHKKDVASAITLKGNVGEKERSFTYEDSFPEKEKENDFIPRIWATRKIGYLLSETRFKGESKELREEIISLSKEYGVMTPYTSFLVLEDEPPRRIAGQPRDRRFRHGQRSDVLTMPGKGTQPTPAPPRPMAESGRDAVKFAQKVQRMKDEEVAAPSRQDQSVKHVGGKTFYLKDGVWVDSNYKEEMKTEKVDYLSEEYFELTRKNPELGKYFAIGDKVIVVFQGKAYQVIPEKETE